MPSELQKLAERVRTIADQCRSWAGNAGRQADRCRSTASRAHALRERGRGNPRVLDALVAQLDTAARECEAISGQLVQLSRLLFEFAAWLAMPAGPAKIASKPATAIAESGLPTPQFAVDAAERLRAQLPRGNKVVGLLFDENGESIGDEIWSGVMGPARGAPGVRRDGPQPWHRYLSVTTHVEGHAAALLRRPGAPRQVTLVVSKDPCGNDYGCAAVIPDVLPRGARVSVFVANEDRTVKRIVPFIGNGKGLE